jgi:hypothetical protein
LAKRVESLRTENRDIKQYPDSRDVREKVYNDLSDTVSLAGYAPRHTGENEASVHVVGKPTADRINPCSVP